MSSFARPAVWLPTLQDLDRTWRLVEEMRPLVDAHVTPERVLRYVHALSDTPAPSTAASAMRAPVLRELLASDGAFDTLLRLDGDYDNTGGTVMIAGRRERPPLWFFAHLDTISYLVQPCRDGVYPLVPFCYHLTENGSRPAQVLRYDLAVGAFAVCANGVLRSQNGKPCFIPQGPPSAELRPGDRVVPVAPFRVAPDGEITGHLDNAGGAAALAVAAPVMGRFGIDALLAFPDEEEGPHGSGNQMIGRGSARLVANRRPPDLAVVVDMQQADEPRAHDGEETIRLGSGAVFSEFSSLARGAVTPPPLYACLRELMGRLSQIGVSVCESSNSYTSRSDDVSVMMATPSIVLLGFPGLDRHFDRAFPRAHLMDLVNLSKALIYVSALSTMMPRTMEEQRAD